MPPTPGGGLLPMIAITREGGRPLHRQIYDSLRSMILEGAVAAGQQIPSTRALAAELWVSRIPVLSAYGQLLAEGYLESRTGAGTFVSESLPGSTASPRPLVSQGEAPESLVCSQASKLLPAAGAAPWVRGTGAFGVGQLAYDHFPFRAWSGLVARHARTVSAASMNYPDPMGSPAFREVLAAYLRTSRALDCDASQIMIVN